MLFFISKTKNILKRLYYHQLSFSLIFMLLLIVQDILLLFINMEPQKSPLDETLQLLEQRVRFFSRNQISAQNILAQPNSPFSILPQLCRFELNQTPLHFSLSDIYLGRQASKIPIEQTDFRFVLPPVSEGEDSITQQDPFEPSFKWVSNCIIDSTFLVTDKIQAKKVQRGKLAPQWKGVVQLLLFNIDRKIYLKNEVGAFEAQLKSRFQKFPWIKFKKVKELYYKGKPSILLKFLDQNQTSFVYFNLSTMTQKQLLGANCEVLRITQNRLKEKLASQVTLVFRRLPLSMTKQAFLSLFKKINPTWMQDLIQICGFKYTICKVKYLDQAFSMITTFMAKGIKEAKVNYHPKSAKQWKINQQNYFEESPK